MQPAAEADQGRGGPVDIPDPVQQAPPAAQRPGVGQVVAFHPDAAAGLDETYDLEVDGQRVAVRVHHGAVEVTPGSPAEHASVSIVTDRQGFIDLARGHATDRLQIQGDTDALDRLQRVFSLA